MVVKLKRTMSKIRPYLSMFKLVNVPPLLPPGVQKSEFLSAGSSPETSLVTFFPLVRARDRAVN